MTVRTFGENQVDRDKKMSRKDGEAGDSGKSITLSHQDFPGLDGYKEGDSGTIRFTISKSGKGSCQVSLMGVEMEQNQADMSMKAMMGNRGKSGVPAIGGTDSADDY